MTLTRAFRRPEPTFRNYLPHLAYRQMAIYPRNINYAPLCDHRAKILRAAAHSAKARRAKTRSRWQGRKNDHRTGHDSRQPVVSRKNEGQKSGQDRRCRQIQLRHTRPQSASMTAETVRPTAPPTIHLMSGHKYFPPKDMFITMFEGSYGHRVGVHRIAGEKSLLHSSTPSINSQNA